MAAIGIKPIVAFFLAAVTLVDGSSLFGASLKHASLGVVRAKDHIDQEHRSKRSFMDLLPHIIQCSANCILPLASVMIQDYFGSPSTFDHIAQLRNEMGMFYEVCKVYQNASDCANSCRSPSFREAIRQMTIFPRFVCVERYQDFQRHLPCLGNVGNETKLHCASQCAHYDMLLSQLNASNVLDKNGGEMFGDLVRQSCEYSACNLDCQRRLVANRCGFEAQRLVQDMVQLSVNSVETLSDTVGFPFAMPVECRRLEAEKGESAQPTSTFTSNTLQSPQSFYQNQKYHHSQGYVPVPSPNEQEDNWQTRTSFGAPNKNSAPGESEFFYKRNGNTGQTFNRVNDYRRQPFSD